MEFVFVALFATFLFLGVVEVAFAVYGRNVVASSAHEAARVALELGSSGVDGEAVASHTVERAAGNLIEGYEVAVSSHRSGDRVALTVRVKGAMDPPGPLPIRVPVDLSATAVREVTP